MRILGIDYGAVRTGMAVSDPTETIASPAGFIKNPSDSLGELAAVVSQKCKELKAEKIVIGLPLHMSGQEGKSAESARKLGSILTEKFGIPVIFRDERLTTCAAEKILIGGNVSRKERKTKIDSVSAAIILQNYLDSINPPPSGSEPDSR